MHKIGFEIFEKYAEPYVGKKYGLAIFLDGNKIPINRLQRFDLHDLIVVDSGKARILNCECGIPECARLDRMINVTRRNGVVTWHIPWYSHKASEAHLYNSGYEETFSKRIYRFDAKQYDQAIIKLIGEIIVPARAWGLYRTREELEAVLNSRREFLINRINSRI